MNNSSIAIIGGADGPTEIFVAGTSPLLYIALAVAAVSLVAVAAILIRKRNKNK